MKIIDLIIEKVFYDLYNDARSIDNNIHLVTDLNFTKETIQLIFTRIETVLNINLSNSFNNDISMGDLRNIVEIAYVKKYRP